MNQTFKPGDICICDPEYYDDGRGGIVEFLTLTESDNCCYVQVVLPYNNQAATFYKPGSQAPVFVSRLKHV